jgi:DNA polymerase elongation subunit (family B)
MLKMNHDFILVNGDTDSISIAKPDGTPFNEDERRQLLNEINSLLPEQIKMDDDGYYESVVVIKTKNYALYDGKKTKIKGSGLKGSSKEPALREFMQKALRYLLDGEGHRLRGLYDEYAFEAMNIKDMKRWAARKTISAKILAQERTMEKKVYEAVKHLSLQEGDRHYLYFKSDLTLKIADDFDGDYCKETMLKKLYLTLKIFQTVIDIEQFPNYSLKKNKKLIEELCAST